MPAERGDTVPLADGGTAELRSMDQGRKLRMRLQPGDGSPHTVLQLYLAPATRERTSLRFHQENLPGPQEREEAREHWRSVLEELRSHISGRV